MKVARAVWVGGKQGGLLPIDINRSHSVGYGLISYVTAYLKYHHKLEFQTALLNSVIGDYAQLSRYIMDSQENGINILPPNINLSKENFYFNKEKNAILIGFSSIKDVGEKVAHEIVANQKFKDFKDFKEKINPTKKSLIPLLKAGAFGVKNKEDKMKGLIKNMIGRKEFKPVKTCPTLKKLREVYGIEESDKEERLRQYNAFREIEFNNKEKERVEKLQKEFKEKYWGHPELWEFEALSMFVTENPLDIHKDCLIDYNKLEGGEQDLVTLGTVLSIENKKDRNGNKYIFANIATSFGFLEITVFSQVYSKYQDLFKRGQCLVLRGNFNPKSRFYRISKVKDYFLWKDEKMVDKK